MKTTSDVIYCLLPYYNTQHLSQYEEDLGSG